MKYFKTNSKKKHETYHFLIFFLTTHVEKNNVFFSTLFEFNAWIFLAKWKWVPVSMYTSFLSYNAVPKQNHNFMKLSRLKRTSFHMTLISIFKGFWILKKILSRSLVPERKPLIFRTFVLYMTTQTF